MLEDNNAMFYWIRFYVPILEGRNREKDEVLLLSSLLRIAGKQRIKLILPMTDVKW